MDHWKDRCIFIAAILYQTIISFTPLPFSPVLLLLTAIGGEKGCGNNEHNEKHIDLNPQGVKMAEFLDDVRLRELRERIDNLRGYL